MKLWLSTLVERFLADPPWAVCPAESFPERFAELEQRLRAAYPREMGFGVRVLRKKDSWVVHVRKGSWSGFAVQCEAVYDAESFGPARVSVWVGTYSRVIHLTLYLLVALVTSPALVLLAKYLVPSLFTSPAVLVAFWPLFLLTACGLFLSLATFLAAAERFRRGEAQLDEVRALVRSVLAADEQVVRPEAARTGRIWRVLGSVIVCAGLISLAGGGWELWEWWFYWDDPVNLEAAQNGALEAEQSLQTMHLVFGAVLSLLAGMLFWGFALLRQRARHDPPNRSPKLAGLVSRESEVSSPTGRPGG